MEEEIIYVYSKAQAIEDGVLFDAGLFGGRHILLTTHLVAELTKEELLKALILGFRRVQRFTGPDMAEFMVNGRRIWIDDSGADLTWMFPEDY
jgi:hypothetical protein